MTTSSAPRLEACVSGANSAAARTSSACVSASLASKSVEGRACRSIGAHRQPRANSGCALHRVALVEARRSGRTGAARRPGPCLPCSTALEKPVRCICTSWSISTSPVARMSPLKPQAAAQQEGLAEGAAVGELGEVQLDAVHAVQRHGSARSASLASASTFGAVVGLVVLRLRSVAGAGSCGFLLSAKRAPLAAALNGSMPTRRSVAMKVSALPSARLALAAVGVEHGLDHLRHFGRGERGADHLAGRGRAATASEPSEPPSVTWYHSLPSLSTPRMPMWPLWWWPQELMQPRDVQVDLAEVVQLVQVLVALR